MKKLLFYAVALLSVATALSGCKKDEGGVELPTPIISVKQPKAYSGMSGAYTINYSIENPREGVLPEANSEDSWITDLSANEKSISFNLSENLSGKERSGTITLSYQDAEGASISITQEGITSLSQTATANCYIVTGVGTYVFPPVKGNSDESVGAVASVEVLWESFGTSDAPNKGDLISEVLFMNNRIYVKTNEEFKMGNALIAAKDEAGKILWSWHIWMTDQPEDQVYKNNAGTMMDRNLGATSALPGDIYAIGLLYQWGRKDPFLGLSSTTGSETAKSTIDPWPSSVDVSYGTIEYAIANPTTFIKGKVPNSDWLGERNDNLWNKVKTIYDPCPPGYKVPDADVWKLAGNISDRSNNSAFDSNLNGSNFGSSGPGEIKFTEEATCWYPLSGFRIGHQDVMGRIAYCGWTNMAIITSVRKSYSTYFGSNSINEFKDEMRSSGFSVRCQKE